MQTRLLTVLAALAGAAAACSPSPVDPLAEAPTSDGAPGALSLSRPRASVEVGDTLRLQLRRRGLPVTTGVRWKVADPSVAGVEDGLVYFLGEGATEIVATTADGTIRTAVSASGQVRPTDFSILPGSLSMEPGDTSLVEGVLSYSNGMRLSLRSSVTWETSSSAVAAIESGAVRAIEAGAATISARLATSAVLTDTVPVTVTSSAPVPPTTAAAPELPRSEVDIRMPAVTGRTLRVRAGQSIQLAVDSARLGDEIVVDPGVTYTGTLRLRKKTSGSGWITIRSGGSLPPAGTRVIPSDAPRMPRLVAATAAAQVISADVGAHHYRLIGLEVATSPTATRAYTLVGLGDGGSSQNTVERMPHHIVLDRMYIHGTPTIDMQRCVALHSAETAIIDSWISECHGRGYDSQAIAGWNGSGPYLIQNNHLAGAGENVMFGGADPKIPGMLPRDITFRRNHFYKDPLWARSWAEGGWTVKNLLELKIGQRVLVEGNVFEHNWSDAQTGFAILFKSTNQSGTAPWSETSDVTVRHNILRDVEAGFSLAGAPESKTAVRANTILIEENIVEAGVGAWKGTGRMFQFGGVPNLTIRNNTTITSNQGIVFAGGGLPDLTIVGNLMRAGTYGITGTTLAEMATKAPGYTFLDNVLATAHKAAKPEGNTYPGAIALPLSVDDFAARYPGVGADLAAVRRATAGVVR